MAQVRGTFPELSDSVSSGRRKKSSKPLTATAVDAPPILLPSKASVRSPAPPTAPAPPPSNPMQGGPARNRTPVPGGSFTRRKLARRT